MKPRFFPTHFEFRKWLEENHTVATEIIVGYYKINSGKKCATYSETVDQALCFGWIDGVRRTIDSESYSNRFTPRKARSNWSDVNIAKVHKLIEQGAMTPAGLAAFEKRDTEIEKFGIEYEAILKGNSTAWSYFESQANWYRKQKLSWIASAKQENTRKARLDKLIEACQAGVKLA